MNRKSISFSGANSDYLSEKVDAGEYSSQSELINALVTQRRLRDRARADLVGILDVAAFKGRSARSPRQVLKDTMEIPTKP